MAINVYISEEEIRVRTRELAKKIADEYRGEELILVGVLNGSYVFTADLCREIHLAQKDFPASDKVKLILEFMAASSYGDETESSGEVRINLDIKKEIKGKHVLLVEDIVDTGLTMFRLFEVLKLRGPSSLKLASLLFKPARNIHKVPIDFLGFEIEDKFVIGYGLDFAGQYRELPFIGIYADD